MKAVTRCEVRRWFAQIVGSSVAIAACHPTPDVCRANLCDDPQIGDAGQGGVNGASVAAAGFVGNDEPATNSAAGSAEHLAGAPGAGAEEAGQGGVGAAPDCVSDADCSDSQGCNGIERCSSGQCMPGVAIACASGSDCEESDAGGICRQNAGFVTYVGDDARPGFAGLVGLFLPPATGAVAIDLSRGALDKDFSGIDEYSWAPNGRRLIFDAVKTDFMTYADYRFYSIEMSARTPGAAQRIANLPVSGQTSFKGWSLDSSAALVADGHDLYAVRFLAGNAEAVRISDAFDGEASFCADGSTVAYGSSDKTYLVSAWASTADSPTVLEQPLISAAPDGHWLLLSSSEQASLAKCALGSHSEALAGAALGLVVWSDDSKYVAYTPSGGLDEVLSVWPVASTTPAAPTFSVQGSDSVASWEPGAARLLYSTSDGDHWYVKDVSSQATALALPITEQLTADPTWAHATGTIAYSTQAGDASDYYLFQLSSQQPTLVLHDANSSVSDIWYSSDLSHAVYLQKSSEPDGERSKAFVLDLVDQNAAKRTLFAEPLAGELQVSQRGSADGNQLILTHSVNSPAALQELYFIPRALNTAVKISGGSYAHDEMLRPTP